MSGHTSGPWEVEKYGRYSYSVLTDVGTVIVTVEGHGLEGNKTVADLIAAAPDLLAVVLELEESAGYWSEYDVPLGIVDRIRAATSKARGEKP